ncbi:glutamate racemase [Defluviitalea phaphyphila]|uniref:glutamate racemase n=1 Tax=Defluviitalea phaphyphila TaxID=1473580 RepID=UPI00073062F7|nr:glutamate racemase [Defluviitalea phaphyphila]
MDERAIGVFDSGVGGLTVVKEIIEQLPNEEIIYFGDTARVPYGSKSKETVTKYSKQIIRFLLTKNIKAIIIACNTASSNSLEEVKKTFDIPIIGVVEPGAVMAYKSTKNNRIGIIGTEATIRSNSYPNAIKKYNKDIETFSLACPLFVPLAEEGWTNNDVAYLVAKKYLEPFKEKDIDTLVLGCTHYPLLKDVIQEIVGDKVSLINPAKEAAKKLKELLILKNQLRVKDNPKHRFYVSDDTTKFEQIASIALKKFIPSAQKIDIEKY